jgi:hypothetical protein
MLFTAAYYNGSRRHSTVVCAPPYTQGLPAFRPSDWTHMHYAVEVYKDAGGRALEADGWKLIRAYAR